MSLPEYTCDIYLYITSIQRYHTIRVVNLMVHMYMKRTKLAFQLLAN